MMGDGVGKGPSAALTTAVIAAAWNSYLVRTGSGPFDAIGFVKELHSTLWRTFRGEQCTTLSLAVLRGETAAVFNCAGPHWLHFSPAEKSVKAVSMRRTNPIGLDTDDGERHESAALKEVTLAPGDLLIAFSDGVVDGYEAQAKLRRSLKAMQDDGEQQFRLIEGVAREAGKDGLPDDFTLVLIRRRAVAAGKEVSLAS